MASATTTDTLQGRIQNLLEAKPTSRAIAFYNDQGRFEWQSLEQFYHRAERAAANLADRGLRRGEVALIVLHSGEVSATVLCGSLLIGALPLLIAPPVVQGAAAFSNLGLVLRHVIGKTRPRLVVCDPHLAAMEGKPPLRRSSPRFIVAEQLLVDGAGRKPALANPAKTDIAAMQLTSGTTGMPRVCVWKQEAVIAALDAQKVGTGLTDDDVCLSWAPLYHDMGLVGCFLSSLTGGIPLVMLNTTDFIKRPALWLRGLTDTGATYTMSPNFGYAITAQRAGDGELEGVRLDRVRAFYNAAERIHYETLVEFHRRFAPYGLHFEALKAAYGCAENVSGATFGDLDGAVRVEQVDRDAMLSQRVAKPAAPGTGLKALTVVGVGRPHAAISVKILSRAGRPLPDGLVGEICLQTPSCMVGYLKDARATRRAIRGNKLHTGDLGYMRDGEVFWAGRVRERITVRGVKLDPSDLEPILLHIPDLRSGCFVAFGVDDDTKGTQRLVVVSEVREGNSRPVEIVSQDVRQQVFERLGVNVNEVMLVRQGTLTKTSSGKRRHRHFLQHYLNGGLQEHVWLPGGGQEKPDGIAG